MYITCVLLIRLVQSHATEPQSTQDKDSTDETISMLGNRMFDWNVPLQSKELEGTMLGKPGHLTLQKPGQVTSPFATPGGFGPQIVPGFAQTLPLARRPQSSFVQPLLHVRANSMSPMRGRHVTRAVEEYCVDCGWVYRGKSLANEPKGFSCPQCQSGRKRFRKRNVETGADMGGSGGGGVNIGVILGLVVLAGIIAAVFAS